MFLYNIAFCFSFLNIFHVQNTVFKIKLKYDKIFNIYWHFNGCLLDSIRECLFGVDLGLTSDLVWDSATE